MLFHKSDVSKTRDVSTAPLSSCQLWRSATHRKSVPGAQLPKDRQCAALTILSSVSCFRNPSFEPVVGTSCICHQVARYDGGEGDCPPRTILSPLSATRPSRTASQRPAVCIDPSGQGQDEVRRRIEEGKYHPLDCDRQQMRQACGRVFSSLLKRDVG